MEKLLAITEPWLEYAVRRNLLFEDIHDLLDLKEAALKDPKIQSFLRDITNFHSLQVTNHKNPELPIHKLLFLLDLGFDTDIPEIQSALNQIMEHKDKNGVFQSLTIIPKHFGGTGTDIFGWCLCDAPLLLLALITAKVDCMNQIKEGTDYLVSLFQQQAFPCSVSEEFGKFRGPGRRSDPCPYATLLMIKLMSALDGYKESKEIKSCINTILSLWEDSLERHPYMFYMGTDFRKIKAPAFWYDIVSVCDTLSISEYARGDSRFLEMIDTIREKQDEDGLFTPESVYQKCKGWDYGQKKTVSPYLSYLCIRILNRI